VPSIVNVWATSSLFSIAIVDESNSAMKQFGLNRKSRTVIVKGSSAVRSLAFASVHV
jgi:hypothetical protein